MKKHLVVIALALAGFMAMTHAALATKPLRPTYRHLYAKLGPEKAGRNLVRDGVRVHGRDVPASNHRIAKSIRTMRVMLMPAPAVAPVNAVQASVASSTPTAPVASSGGMPACTWRPESGGSYTAVNPTSGAYGKYQIIPSTWAAHCSGISRSPSGQETCARRVMAAQGSGAWVNC